MTPREVIIIGGGPAGFTAALYTARAQLQPLVLAGEQAGGQLMLTTEVENYPGYRGGIQGPKLMAEMRLQAAGFGAEILNENVTKVDLKSDLKKVWVGETEYQAKAVILALGAKAKMLGIGEEKLLGRGVSTCAVCDAAFFKGATTFVVGGGDAAIEEVAALKKFAKSVTLIHRRDTLRASKIMQKKLLEELQVPVLWSTEVVKVQGETKLTQIGVKNNLGVEQTLAADGLFLAIGHEPATDFLKGQLALDERDYLLTQLTSSQNAHAEWLQGFPTQTSVKGVFGAGDVVDFRYRQAISAAGMGCQAALDAEKYLTGSFGSW